MQAADRTPSLRNKSEPVLQCLIERIDLILSVPDYPGQRFLRHARVRQQENASVSGQHGLQSQPFRMHHRPMTHMGNGRMRPGTESSFIGGVGRIRPNATGGACAIVGHADGLETRSWLTRNPPRRAVVVSEPGVFPFQMQDSTVLGSRAELAWPPRA